MRVRVLLATGALIAIGCSTSDDSPRALETTGADGNQYHLGPVDWDETQWHNACAPPEKYSPAIRKAQGELLAGLWAGVPNVTQYCDACIEVTTARGRSAILRVVTYGDTTPGSIDVSPAAYELLNAGEYPRKMTWKVTKCKETANVVYEFRNGAHEYWTSFWVRLPRLPITKVEVKSANHPEFVELPRGTDGALTDEAGFGVGPFTIRSTASDGQQLVDTFDWPSGGVSAQLLEGQSNLK